MQRRIGCHILLYQFIPGIGIGIDVIFVTKIDRLLPERLRCSTAARPLGSVLNGLADKVLGTGGCER